MKIAVKLRSPDPIWEGYIGQLEKLSEVLLIFNDKQEESYPDIEMMITTNINEEELSRFPALRHIFLFKTGTDNIPVEYLTKRKITLTNSHANAGVIAEHAVTLALSLLHRVNEFHTDLTNGIWYSDGTNFHWNSLGAMNTGILGYGCIGKKIAELLQPFGCQIYAFNRNGIYTENVTGVSSLEQLIDRSDILFICLPKTKETINLIDASILKKMTGKYIVNVGRAEICNEEALYHSLAERNLAGYASDVWYSSPDKKNKLKSVMPSAYHFENLHNVVMSPHCATHEFFAHERYIKDAVNACLQQIAKENDHDSI